MLRASLALLLSLSVVCTYKVEDLEDLVLWQQNAIQQKDQEIQALKAELQNKGSCAATDTDNDAAPKKKSPKYLRPYKKHSTLNGTRIISWESPRVFVVENFLNDTECDHIVKVSDPLLKESAVVGATDGAGLRKSKSAFLPRSWEKTDPMVKSLIQKIHEMMMVPVDFGEELQVTSYKVGDKYEFHKDSDSQVGRMATVLMYLIDVEEGGETIIPAVTPKYKPDAHKRKGKRKEELQRLNYNVKDHPNMEDYCDSDDFFKVIPKKGTALVFFNHLPDLRADPYALHGACPIKKGRKIVAQRWIRFWNHNEGNKFWSTFIKGSRFE
eukprot:TRINITY_DN63413_c0_g1_i1.p1 TRINITY_DN63413_c0_g1~~TRINITY_DN63413_c0_g1_i1.p1  ORF type:complete len:326 (-),score=46.84 TRINITY_DN63413_c0_g1_i1:871-1848(-)